MADAQRIYWDASVFTVLLHENSERGETCRRLLEDAEDRKIQLVTSFQTIAEVYRYSGEASDAPRPLCGENGEQLTAFLENDYFLYVAVDRIVAERAQALCRRYPIDPHQALHLASALRAGARQFHTYAGDALCSLSGTIGDPPLPIRAPTWTGQLSLLETLFGS